MKNYMIHNIIMTQDFSFIGKNIRFYRRSRNWTLKQLASKIGIQEGPLGRIERGLNLPSATVIFQLSQVLKIPTDAIFASRISQAQAVVEADSLFMATGSESLPAPLIDACREIMQAFHSLEDICQVQKHARLPLFIPFEPNYSGMEQLAEMVRNYLGISNAIVFDYFELFENFGLRILVFPFMRQARDIESVSFYEPGHHNAFFFLNALNNPEKQLFSLALELGKILIFNQIKNCEDKYLFLPVTKEQERPINELRAAKRFAATFLAPATTVHATISQLGITPGNWTWDLLLRIKHRFGVSAESFLYRLRELNLISDKSAEEIQSRIQTFYNNTKYKEPGSSKRILNPNGRFFDLLLTASSIESEETEEIHEVVNRYKIMCG